MINTTKIDNSNFLRALLKGNRVECSRILHDHIDNDIAVNDLYEKVIRKSLYEVGELWEMNRISVATEHLASAIVEALLNDFYNTAVQNDKSGGKVIFACVENEFHQIGIKMVSDIFEMNGWNSFFLGANTPTKDLISFLELVNPSMLAISLSISSNIPVLEKMIWNIDVEVPNLPILVGGQAFRRGGLEVIARYPNVTYLPDLYSIDKFANNFQLNGRTKTN
ncbi:MAG: cobalamin-binding protein [Proteiniphilum sp.]|jgi:methanogenic corrinoid protein MtbC1|nr:cobalamin-binding protein [Proteiniphilum sp.]